MCNKRLTAWAFGSTQGKSFEKNPSFGRVDKKSATTLSLTPLTAHNNRLKDWASMSTQGKSLRKNPSFRSVDKRGEILRSKWGEILLRLLHIMSAWRLDLCFHTRHISKKKHIFCEGCQTGGNNVSLTPLVVHNKHLTVWAPTRQVVKKAHSSRGSWH